MALVNVAAELAKSGRRVLMVDFDLEAPGLSDFELLDTSDKTPGLVEFINDYLATQEVPNVENYLYLSKKYEDTQDRLWIMPAGCQKGDYQSLFSGINWQTLYDSQNGYLLMEDLRAQWETLLRPDYVFIDSRTGYTDIAGICTRQLPDAVCLLFSPNKQNLTGLTRITSEIKAQSKIPELRKPKLHFVASNIPSLDDDEDVLKKALGKFSDGLNYVNPSAIIHHYNSFALINESVFTLEFPKNPLALEYKQLAEELTRENIRDRIVALNFLRGVSRRETANLDEGSVDKRLYEIEQLFQSDPEILFALSRARRVLGNLEDADILLDSAIRNGLDKPLGYLDRAISKLNRYKEIDGKAIWNDLHKIFSMPGGVQPSELLWSIKIAARVGRHHTEEIRSSPAIHALKNSDVLFLVDKLRDSTHNTSLSNGILSDAIGQHRIDAENLNDALSSLAMGYMGVGKLAQAIEIFSDLRSNAMDWPDVSVLFNLAMAKYWSKEDGAIELFRDVRDRLSLEQAKSANSLQCLSFVEFALDDPEAALVRLKLAREKITEQSSPTFSCWRYLEVSPAIFREDLNEMERLYGGLSLSPPFLIESTHHS